MVNKVKKFISEVRTEMSKVTWSSREELVNSALIVLAAMAFMSVFIGATDIVMSQIMKLILR